ncbi:MAG: hypothetical protein V3U60_16595 [Gammaproteobacteria bacterium]
MSDTPITIELLPGGWSAHKLDDGRVMVVTSTVLEADEAPGFATAIFSMATTRPTSHPLPQHKEQDHG